MAQRASAALDDEKRYKRNRDKIEEALRQIYATFYHNKQRRAANTTVYKMLGKEQSGYLADKVEGGLFKALFVGENADYFVHKQVKKIKQGHKESKAEYEQRKKQHEKDKLVAEGDIAGNHYYHVHNQRYESDDRTGKARRIVVNVATQADAVRVSRALIALYQSGTEAATHISEFKLYLGNKGGASVKKDKLVIYYDYVAGEGGADYVGDTIVAVVAGSGATFGADLAPFYSYVAPGIAWAQEPKYYSKDEMMKGSFTRTRANVIGRVIDGNAVVDNEQAFIKLVREEFARHGVDLDSAHRHIIG